MGLTTKTALKPEASPLEIYSDKLVQKKKIQDIRMFTIALFKITTKKMEATACN